MAPRTILHTGAGGAGRTSVAAATARGCAAAGHRTLLLALAPDPAFTAALGTAAGPEPREVAPGLWAQEIAPRVELARSRLAPAVLERLAALPGLQELLGLLALAARLDDGAWDVVVVDGAPAPDLLRTLALPDLAGWWLERVLPQHGRLLDAARPLARAVLGAGAPGEALLDEVDAVARRLAGLGDALRDGERCTARVVLGAGAADPAAARRLLTHLALHGLAADAVVLTRELPEAAGAWGAGRRAAEQEQARALEGAVAPLPLLRAPWLVDAPPGPALLDGLAAALWAGADPARVLHPPRPDELVVSRDGASLRVALPHARREELALRRVGEVLELSSDGHGRPLRVPPALADYRPAGARFEDGALHIAFDPPA